MYLYHGSTTPPHVVKAEGLKPLEPGEVIEAVLSEFDFKDKIPEQIVTYIQYELIYRSDQRSSLSKEALQVHLTASRRQAEGYGTRKGGEFADNVRWACRRYCKKDREKEVVKTYVYVIDTGSWIPEQVGIVMKRCAFNDIDFNNLVEVSSWDVTLSYVAPDMIAGYYRKGGGSDESVVY